MNSVAASLNDIFRKHRLVFWYDAGEEMRAEYDAYAQAEVEKVEVHNNEFGLKHRMVREAPNEKFLIYLPYERPPHARNWLLDLELANHVFRADGISLLLQEMGWPEEFRGFIEGHREFFNSRERRERLRERLHEVDHEGDWRLKMVSVVTRSEPNLQDAAFALLEELDAGKEEKYNAIGKFGLHTFLWDHFAKHYDYRSASPTLLDFIFEVFVTAAPCGRKPKLGRDARVFLA